MTEALAKLIDLRAVEPIDPELVSAVARYAAQAPDITITDQATYDEAVEYLRLIQGVTKQVDAEGDKRKRSLLDALNEMRDEHGALNDQLGRAKATVLALKNAWDTKLAMARRAEQDRLDAAAARERARLEERARKAAEAGKHEKAAVLEQQAAAPQPRQMPVAPPPPKGMSKRQVWRYEITNAALVPREYCSPDEGKIGGTVRTLKETANIPGVKIWMEETDVIRS